MKREGFTVWELLGVLAILFVIAYIIFPVFAPVHKKNPQITCASIEKQLGLAFMQYVQDNDDSMPDIADAKTANVTWRNMIYPYVKSNGLYQCPSRHDFSNGLDGLPKSYAANYTGNYSGSKKDWGQGAFAGTGSKPLGITDFDMPAELIMLCEVWHSNRPDFNIDNLGVFNPKSDSLWAGHTDGGNYLLADGHVKYFKPLDTKAYWHRNSSTPLSAGSIKVLQNAHKGQE